MSEVNSTVTEPKVENPIVETKEEKLETVSTEAKKEEAPKEEDKILEKPKDEMNLLEVVVHYLDSEKTEIPLTPQMEKLMKKLPAVDKEHLENVEGFFNEIMEDKKINMKDLPHLIGLLQEIFILYDSLRMKASAQDVSMIIKNLIQLLILYRLENSEKLSKEQKEVLLQSLDSVLELCVQMIDLKDTQKKLRKWLGFLPCF
jgi:hypothetical protein